MSGPVKERQELLKGFENANIDIVEAARIDLYRARMFLPKLKSRDSFSCSSLDEM